MSQPGKTCASVELIWGTRCEKAPGHESSGGPSDRLHTGLRAPNDRLWWGSNEDMRAVFA